MLHLLTETLAIFSRASSLGRKCSSAEPWTQTNSITSILLASVFTQDHLYLTTALSIKLKLEQLHCLLGHFKGITTDIKLSKQELSTPPPMYTSRVEGKAMSGHRSENHSPNCTKGPGTPVTMCGLRGCAGISSTHCSSMGNILMLCIPLIAYCKGKLTHSGHSPVTQLAERHYCSCRGPGSSPAQITFPVGYSLYSAYMSKPLSQLLTAGTQVTSGLGILPEAQKFVQKLLLHSWSG